VTDTTPERWRRVKEIASAALDLEEYARLAYVATACSGDEPLAGEVRSLLASTAAATPYFETPGGGGTATLLTGGTAIGPYRIIRELASGGMGSVYLAERDDGEFRQRVAIKVVRGGFANEFLLQRFRDERRILATLEHANIARLLDGGTTSAGLPYVVMEYVEGEPIDAFCAGRALPLRERLAVFQQVCAAVQHAHQHLVIHRDIKAANILVTANGTPKLLDFGIAKLLDPETGLQFGAHTTVRVMTPESASPEQVSGGPVTVAADVYGLGVLLYRLLAGRGPYKGPLETETQVMRAVCEQVPDPPSTAHTSGGLRVPQDVDRIVMKALRKEPERRYDSAGQLADDIQRFLDGRPVLASPDSLRYRTRKFVGRHAIAAGAGAAVIVAIVGGLAATAWQARVAERERRRAERQFTAVRGLAQSVLGELHDAVTALPGSTAAREILLRRGTEYLDALSAEARDDLPLRRELAAGYARLATVQGLDGLPNLGNQAGTQANLKKAISLLEPMAGSDRGDVRDRLRLADNLARLAASYDATAQEAEDPIRRAREILERLTPAERSTAHALTIRQIVWGELAARPYATRDYRGARAALEEMRQAAEDAWRLEPTLNASRNLSLAYKRLGASMEMLKETSGAIVLYEKALDLDLRRVAAEPSQSQWRLDLSFAHGAIGAATMSSDPAAARARYEEAVKLREQVVREDPDEDFAKVSLARGYERLALIRGRLGDVAPSIDYNRRRLQVFRDRMAAHPERDNLWREYTLAVFNAAQFHAGMIDSAKGPAERRLLAARVTALLDDVATTQGKWKQAKRPGALPPAAADIEKVRAGLEARSSGRSAADTSTAAPARTPGRRPPL
jgi:tetratricopeptide (TPR) repeat protein